MSRICALLLCTDLKPQQKEPLLVNYVQVGIDPGGMVRSGHPGWTGWGGHGSGRKLPIVFAGLMLGDEELAKRGDQDKFEQALSKIPDTPPEDPDKL